MERRNNNKKRVIVDYNKLNKKILDLLVEKYPDGYNDGDIIAFKNIQNEYIECVQIETEDTIYLVKVSKRLDQAIEDHFEDEDLGSDDLTINET